MKPWPCPADALPQLHSCDGFVRMHGADLAGIVFEHLYTVQEASVLAGNQPGHLRAGITEWQGSFGTRAISLAWDWAQEAGGAIVPLPEVAPRTNVRLIDARGYDMGERESLPALWAAIAALGWRAPVRASLAPAAALVRH